MADIRDPGHDIVGMKVTPGTSSGGMRDARFEVENEKVKLQLNQIARKVGGALDKGWGFLLMLFEYGPGGSMFYISSAERENCIDMAQEWIDKQRRSDSLRKQELNPDDPTTRAVHDHWHKIVALLMMRMAADKGVDVMQLQVNFKSPDIDAFAALGRAAVGIKDDADGMTLFIASEDEAIEQIKAGKAKLDPPPTAEERRDVEGS